MHHALRIPVSEPLLTLTQDNFDGVCSWLVGNGELCTTLGPTGMHDPQAARWPTAAATQHFVLAGRRGSGPQHPLLDFGRVTSLLLADGQEMRPVAWRQQLDLDTAVVHSSVLFASVQWRAATFVPLHVNAFLIHFELAPADGCPHDIYLSLAYALPPGWGAVRWMLDGDTAVLRIASSDNMFTVRIACTVLSSPRPPMRCERDAGIAFVLRERVTPCAPLIARLMIQWSDRIAYSFPLASGGFDRTASEHVGRWQQVLNSSRFQTGVRKVDLFRQVALYTLRSQLTPWSIGPTLSERYWGGGAFHDEMYPFFALISANLPDLATRLPYFRRTILASAAERARGRGALYPWSSTEAGQERDPDGLWLTERFHLAQFAAECWGLWLYEKDVRQLEELYPVLREVALYYEANLLERGVDGRLRTAPCVDFDESVGAVRNGPFTVAGVRAALRWAARAARVLGTDIERAGTWDAIAEALASAVYTENSDLAGGEVFGIPGGMPFHYSVLGHVFPFRTEVGTERAKRTAAAVQKVCRSTVGWKPGFSEVYDGSSWLWTAGHLAIVNAMHAEASPAWEALRDGIECCVPAMIPNEHVDASGVVHVPWFTTGVGAWLYGLHACAVWLDESATHLASALPPGEEVTFEALRGAGGVLISGRALRGRIESLAARAPQPLLWRYSVPHEHASSIRPRGTCIGNKGGRLIFEVPLRPDVSEILIEGQTAPGRVV